MPTREFFRERIEKELAVARLAAGEGNNGMARVAARRAAGLAIGWFLEQTPGRAWGADAMTRLRHAAEEPAFPPEVRAAAARLTAKISDRFTYPPGADPIADASVIVNHLLPPG